MTNLPEFAVAIIRQYANETGTKPRSTSDISPFEEWLIIQLYNEALRNSNPLRAGNNEETNGI